MGAQDLSQNLILVNKKKTYTFIPDEEKSHGFGTQESCEKNAEFPTILGLGTPSFRKHSRQKKVYLYRKMPLYYSIRRSRDIVASLPDTFDRGVCDVYQLRLGRIWGGKTCNHNIETRRTSQSKAIPTHENRKQRKIRLLYENYVFNIPFF